METLQLVMSLPDLATTGQLIWKDFNDKTKWWQFDSSVSSPGCRFVFGGPTGTGAGTFRYNFPAGASINNITLREINNNFQTDQTVNGTAAVNRIQFNSNGQGTDQYWDESTELKFDGPFGTPSVPTRLMRFGNNVTVVIRAMTDTASSAAVFTATERVPNQYIPSFDTICSVSEGCDNGTKCPIVCCIATSGIITIGKSTSNGSFTGSGTTGWEKAIVLHYIIE